MPPPLPKEVRDDVEALFDREMDCMTIASLLNISVRQVQRMKQNCNEFGTVTAPKVGAQGRPRLLDEKMGVDLLEYLKKKPTACFDEMACFLFYEFQVEISPRSINRYLKRAGWSRRAVGDVLNNSLVLI